MYQKHREVFFLCIRNTGRCSSYVSGTQGGGVMYQEHRRCSSYVSGTQGGGLLKYQERGELLFLCIRNTVRSSYVSGTQEVFLCIMNTVRSSYVSGTQ